MAFDSMSDTEIHFTEVNANGWAGGTRRTRALVLLFALDVSTVITKK